MCTENLKGAIASTTRAVVAERVPGDLRISTIDIDEPRRDEARVRMVASGVCHTDAVVRAGMIPTPLPAVLGHEGAGVVEAVGADVTRVRVGDHVVLSANSCGQCRECLSGRQAYCADLFGRNFGAHRADGSSSFSRDGELVGSNFFGQSSFSEHSNIAERSLIKVDSDLDLTVLAPLGCGINTGAGTILNEFRPGAGASVVVFGTGAVGTAAIMAARLTGATRIVAVDIVSSRLALAAELGATHTLDGSDPDLLVQLIEASGGRGFDFALDTTGRPQSLRTAVDALAVRGIAAEVGSARSGTEVSLETGESMNRGWGVRTVIQGSSVPQIFVPALIELWKQGRFPVDRLITTYPLASINDAFKDAERGITIKPVVTYEGAH